MKLHSVPDLSECEFQELETFHFWKMDIKCKLILCSNISACTELVSMIKDRTTWSLSCGVPFVVYFDGCRLWGIVALQLVSLALTTHFTNNLWAHNSKPNKNACHPYMKNNGKIMSQFCICHDSWAVVTCANVWGDWIIKIVIIGKRIFTRFPLRANAPFVIHVPDWFQSWDKGLSRDIL